MQTLSNEAAPTEETPLEKAVRVATGQTELANKISAITGKNIRQGHIWNWINRPSSKPMPPAELVIAIEEATGVPRWELRPDIYPKPENTAS